MNNCISEVFLNSNKKILILPLVIIIVLIDQLSKIILRNYISLGESIPILKNIFELTHTENTGAAFSLFSGQVQILTMISIVATIIIITYLYLEKTPLSKLQLLGWAFLLGGTNGNLIDRLFIGSVTDFFNVIIINFPIFNLADVFIDIGAMIIIFTSFFSTTNAKSEQ